MLKSLMCRFVLLTRLLGAVMGLLTFSSSIRADVPASTEHEDRLAPDHPDMATILSPDWSEPKGAPAVFYGSPPAQDAFGNIASSAQQQQGALSGRIVFMNSGHGWTHDTNFTPPWRLQRGVGNQMNEDYGNLDQLNFFAAYCFNAGATVVSMRPLGQQTNEVILDNDDAAVTFTGSWSDSSSTIFWGSPGNLPYRYASFAATQTATATYTPAIPVTGYYPVYCWTQHGANRGDQLYRIRHTGGESLVRVPHHMVGNGWIYLGEYYFNAGANASIGSVVISNLRGTPTGSVVIADAIRFGNGMGTVNQGGGVSDYPREDENMRYWVKANLAQGQTNSLYEGSGSDESDSWSAPPKMSAEMNLGPRQHPVSGGVLDHKRIHISFHSNAGGGRGTLALITSDPTPNQTRLAQIAGGEVDSDLVALGSPPLELPWSHRTTVTYSGGYSEIDGSLFNYEMDATIIEVAFHDSVDDAKLLRDSKARAAVGKAAMHAVIKYMNEFDALPLNFPPEPPTNVRAIGGANGQITLSWTAPMSIGGSGNPTNYVIYRSTNGYGFGNPVFVGNVTNYTISNLAANLDYYFRVAASNPGGESMPSEVAGCRASTTLGALRVLFVNAFDRFDRTTNLRQDTTRQNYIPPDATGTIERVWPRRVNAFDYVVQHGKAISAFGTAFDSCQNEAVGSGQVALTNYPIVIWAAGNESTADESFSSNEQSRVTTFLSTGGSLFVSGSEIAWDLDRASGPLAADRAFLTNQLHADLNGDANDNSQSYTFTPAGGSIFAGNADGAFDDGSKGIYWVGFPDVLTPVGAGAVAALNYVGGLGGAAAIQYDGSAGGGRVVYFGFPFETITSASARNAAMADILTFLNTAVAPSITAQPQSRTINQGENATFNVAASGTAPLSYQWRRNDTNLSGAISNTLSYTNVQASQAGNYSVVVANNGGAVTSAVAVLMVNVPPMITQQPQSQTVKAGANATFTVAVTGTSPLSYQWQFDETNIADATGSNYTRLNAQTNHAGSYRVVITNIAGLATSDPVLLTVNPPQPAQFESINLLPDQRVQLVLGGEAGCSYVIQGSTNLVHWVDLTNVFNASGTFEFIDSLATNQAQRFYRTLTAP